MKQVHVIQMLMAVVMVLTLGSCSSDDLSEVENQNDKQTVKMELVCKVIGFDQQSSDKAKVQTRATSSSWNDGDKIYITFFNALPLFQAKPLIAELLAGRSVMMEIWQQAAI